MRLLDTLFPPLCGACGDSGRWPLCHGCAARVGVVMPPWCVRCGRPTEAAVASCVDCPPGAIERARSPFLYEGPISALIRGMKFAGWHAAAPSLAAAMTEVAGELEGEVVTWVPLSRRRRSRRGFDQAECLADAVGGGLDLPVRRLLLRTREARAQARRGGAERRRASGLAFRALAPVPEAVLLVDDVLTTGSTAAACAEALHDAGARRVQLLTAARSLGGPVPRRCFGMERATEPRVR